MSRRSGQRVGVRKRAGPVEPGAECLALDEGHDIVEKAVGVAGIDEAHDVRVREAGGDLDFLLEPVGAPELGHLGVEHLEHDATRMLALLRQEHRGGSAATDELMDDVPVTQRARELAGDVVIAGYGRTVERSLLFVGAQQPLHQFPQRRIPGAGLVEPPGPVGAAPLAGLLEDLERALARFVVSCVRVRGTVGVQVGVQQGAGPLPVALHRSLGDAERLRHLRVGESAEVAILHHVAEAPVERPEPVERLVERDQLLGRYRLGRRGVAERRLLPPAAATLRLPAAGAVNQDLAHCARGHGQEVRPVLPVGGGAQQAEERVVDQLGRLHRLGITFAAKQGRGAPPQLRLHQRIQPVDRLGVAPAMSLDEGSDRTRSCFPLVDVAGPVVLEQAGQAPVGQHPPAGLAPRTVVRLVLGVADALHRRTAHRAWLPEAPVHRHRVVKGGDLLGESIAGLGAEPIGPFGEGRCGWRRTAGPPVRR